MIPQDKEFIVALIEEAQESLDDLKESIQKDDGPLFHQTLMRLSGLRLAAQKWMEED